jgi:hypothetical protein
VLKQEKFPFFAFLSKGPDSRAFVLFFCQIVFISFFGSFSMANTIICKNEKSVRTLRTDNTSKGCQAIYTKQGIDQVVGSSTQDNACDSIIEGIRKTLEGSVWKCRGVKEAVISNLSE